MKIFRIFQRKLSLNYQFMISESELASLPYMNFYHQNQQPTQLGTWMSTRIRCIKFKCHFPFPLFFHSVWCFHRRKKHFVRARHVSSLSFSFKNVIQLLVFAPHISLMNDYQFQEQIPLNFVFAIGIQNQTNTIINRS